MTLLAVSGILFAVGAIFGNMVLIAMSLPPFFLFILGVLLTPPRRITADTPDIPKNSGRGRNSSLHEK